MKNILFILIIFIFNGCYGLIETNVKLSDLQSTQSKHINGDLYVEVIGCTDFSDSRKLSDSVIQSQQQIPFIFKGAQYIECFQREFQSFTHFTIPLVIDTNSDSKLVSNEYVNLISNSNELLSVGIPQSIKNNLERVKQSSYGMTDIDLNVQINVENDTEKTVLFDVISAYINDYPYVLETLKVTPNKLFSVKLSDVSVDTALQNGKTNILLPK